MATGAGLAAAGAVALGGKKISGTSGGIPCGPGPLAAGPAGFVVGAMSAVGAGIVTGTVGAAGADDDAAGIGGRKTTPSAAACKGSVTAAAATATAVSKSDSSRLSSPPRADPLRRDSSGIAMTPLSSVPSGGMRNVCPQSGQTPRLPARNDLTLSLCPFGQRNRMPIVSGCRRAAHLVPSGWPMNARASDYTLPWRRRDHLAMRRRPRYCGPPFSSSVGWYPSFEVEDETSLP